MEDDVKPDFKNLGDGELVGYCGDDAGRWAEAFMAMWGDRLAEIDEGLMIGWFANAIEHACDLRSQ